MGDGSGAGTTAGGSAEGDGSGAVAMGAGAGAIGIGLPSCACSQDVPLAVRSRGVAVVNVGASIHVQWHLHTTCNAAHSSARNTNSFRSLLDLLAAGPYSIVRKNDAQMGLA